MAWGLKRYQETGQLHFITFSCFDRAPLLGTPQARDIFLEILERVRRWYAFTVVGYVVMPEHVHLIVSEPKQRPLALTLQMIKQMVSRKLRSPEAKTPFWSPRYCDFNLWTESKRIEKVRLYASQSGEKGPGRKAGGLGMEQLSPLPQWRRRSGGNRVAVDSR